MGWTPLFVGLLIIPTASEKHLNLFLKMYKLTLTIDPFFLLLDPSSIFSTDITHISHGIF